MFGYLTKPGVTFIDTRKVDLNKLSVIELRDILIRQDSLLSNGKFINSLPDKGQKIKEYRQKVHEKLKAKELVEETTSILAKLNLSQKVDLQHPMASDSSSVLKSQVDPYAKVLTQVLDETLPKVKVPKFVPSKCKDEIKKETSGSSTPESLKMVPDQCSRSNHDTLPLMYVSEQSTRISAEPKSNTPKSSTSKSKSEQILEKYKDTGLVYGPREVHLHELSVDESLALSKSQIEKERQMNVLRRVERTIRLYEQADACEDEEESDNEGASDDEKGTSIVVHYMK